jgi:ABC-2 type transport system permease protein
MWSKAQRKALIIWCIGALVLVASGMILGSAIGAFLNSPKSAPSITAIILFAAYLLSMFIDLNNKLEYLLYLTPFKYFEAKNILVDNGFAPIFIILSFVIIIVQLRVTYHFYQKRDLR